MRECGYSSEQLWKLWHGDNHLIADDKLGKGDWKEKCGTFDYVIEAMKNYFKVDVKATRINWYKDKSDWKPYHRDAAAIDDRKAKTQNITIAVTFGCPRTASFVEYNDDGGGGGGGGGGKKRKDRRIDFPLTNGSIYVFSKQVNIDWMHGIVPEGDGVEGDGRISDEGRISIIIWGWSSLYGDV